MKRIILVLLMVLLATLALQAQVTSNGKYIGFSGYLTSGGVAVNGNQDFRFSIWRDETSTVVTGNKVWEEEHLTVSVVDGEFSIFVGSEEDLVGNPLWPDLNFSLDIQYWLQIEYKAAGDLVINYTAFPTRKMLLSVPNTYTAGLIEVLAVDPANPVTGQMWLVVP